MGRKKRRGKSGMAFVAALGVALASFPAFAGTTLVVGKAVATNPSMMAVNVGDQVGFFKKHGLDLKIVNFGGGARMVQALTAGSIDIGSRSENVVPCSGPLVKSMVPSWSCRIR